MNYFKQPACKSLGFSLIELMIGMTISLIVIVGIIKIFDTSSSLNRTQMGLARIQENGRFTLVNIKQNAEQIGYQYCLSSSYLSQNTKTGSPQRFWKVYSGGLAELGFPSKSEAVMDEDNDGVADVISSISDPYFIDPAYFLHGHECNDTECSPNFNSVGTDKSFTLPEIGTNDGNRIADTDVLTMRYISGSGREVETIQNLPNAEITYTQNTIDTNFNIPVSGDTVLIASCNDMPVIVVDSINSSSEMITLDMPELHRIQGGESALTKVFSLAKDFKTITYYVENDIVDGRDIPTLYSVINGVKNPLVQGVDRFDVIYGVQTSSSKIKYITADEVQNIPESDCIGLPYKDSTTGVRLLNTTGCAWRSIVSIEVHLLLNTISNSSTKNNESFVYSIDGQTRQLPSDLKSGIEHYNMYRKEFATTIALKNY